MNENPNDLTARWLLNIAHMTLGQYPDKVPPKWLISPKIFESDYDIKRFYDVAPHLGLDVLGLAGGVSMDDFDGDGDLDLMVSRWGHRDQIRYFSNNGNGTFADHTEQTGLKGIVGGLNLVHADYNNDGYPDIFVLRGAWLWSAHAGCQPNSLLRNNGNGTFDDVTEEAGLLTFQPTQTAVWGDFNNDGWVDLFIGNESSPQEKHPCELFRNNADGTFTEVAADVGVAHIGIVKGVAAGDYNNDGLLDLYLSDLQAPNTLYRNEGEKSSPGKGWRFKDVTKEAGVGEPRHSFPTWFWDYNNDGWLDLFVSGYLFGTSSGDVAASYLGLAHKAELPRLYCNNRDGSFSDVTNEVKLDKILYTMGCNFGDLDSDGYLDFYVGTGDPGIQMIIPNRMFRNAKGEFFQDVTTSGGFGHLQKGHAIAFGDLDNDGDQDVYEVIGGGHSGDVSKNVLFENPGHGNHWITLILEGVKSNRSAIGARIRISIGSNQGPRDIYATVSTGGSFGSSSLQQEIGLGLATSIRKIEVTWPASGKTQIFRNVAKDQTLKIIESKPDAIPVNRKQFKLSSKGARSQHSEASNSH